MNYGARKAKTVPYLKQRDIIIVRDAGVVLGVRSHALDLDLLAVVGVRAASRDAQLDRPAVHVRVAGTAIIL